MELFDITQAGLDAAIRSSAMRQQAIAQNLANANTPGYKRQDVSFGDTLAAAMSSGDRSAVESFRPTESDDSSAPMRVDGNSVDVDEENARSSQNGLLYESLISVSKSRMDIMRSAMGVG